MPSAPSAKKMMLAISSRSPKAKSLIEAAAHLADQLQAEWFVVHVQQTPATEHPVPESDLEHARSLGARIIIEPMRGSAAGTLVKFARSMGIDYLVTGRSVRPRFTFLFWRLPLAEYIQRKLPQTVVLII
jgi:K+-sensing histidine kinase KdpD